MVGMKARRLLFILVCVYMETIQAKESKKKQSKGSVPCQKPSRLYNLFKKLNKHIYPSEKFFRSQNLPWDENMMKTLSTDKIVGSHTVGSQTCPNKASSKPGDPLCERSLCPWYYNITELPEGHYPRFIPQAMCKCANCIESRLNQCERVSVNIRVLKEKKKKTKKTKKNENRKKKGCQRVYNVYKPKTIRQYVGCLCAKRRVG